MRIITLSAVLALCLSAAAPAALAQFDGYGRWEHGFGEPAYLHYAREEADAMRARWHQVESENKGRADEWAGDYVEHGELSFRVLRWAPRAGFVHTFVHTCEPAVHAFAYGRVSVGPNLIRMRTEIRRQLSHHHHGRATPAEVDYLPVKWAQRRYLVPKTKVREFYNFVAGHGWGAGEWPGDFLVRVEDRDKPVSGMPILPPGYERFVRRPIEATVTRVGRRVIKRHVTPYGDVHFSRTPITLNVGSAHGIRRGMHLYLIGSDYPETIDITRVGRRVTVAVIKRVWEEGVGEAYQDRKDGAESLKPYVPLAVGSRLTTSFELYHSETQPPRR